MRCAIAPGSQRLVALTRVRHDDQQGLVTLFGTEGPLRRNRRVLAETQADYPANDVDTDAEGLRGLGINVTWRGSISMLPALPPTWREVSPTGSPVTTWHPTPPTRCSMLVKVPHTMCFG